MDKREEFLTSGYVVFDNSRPWVTQGLFNLCKTKALYKHCFRPNLERLKYSREVSMIILVDIECIDYSWIFDFFENGARELRSYSMPKPKEFVHNESETFWIASPFWTNSEYSHRVQFLYKLFSGRWHRSRSTIFFLSVYAQARKFPQPQSQDYNSNRWTFLNKNLQFKD